VSQCPTIPTRGSRRQFLADGTATAALASIASTSAASRRTTIEELYAWQFDGPAHRDMRGVAPKGQARDAGAIESD
jgi:hypothetical protein